jgi:hypothetical protein
MTKVICPEPGSQLTIGSVTALMTEPTPRTDCFCAEPASVVPAEFARTLERSLARKEALLRHWVRLLRSELPTTITSALIAEIERELEGK